MSAHAHGKIMAAKAVWRQAVVRGDPAHPFVTSVHLTACADAFIWLPGTNSGVTTTDGRRLEMELRRAQEH